MPFLRLNEIKEMSPPERDIKLRELRVELAKLRAMIKAGGSLENPSQVREIRRAIARIKTIQNEESAGRGRE